MDTMDSIGTAFHPLIQQEWNFLNLSRIDKCTFPSESIRFQWIRWTPSERLSTPSSNMSGIFLSLSRIENELFHRNLFVSNASKHLVGLYTTRLPVFRWKARGYDWILVDSIGQPSKFKRMPAPDWEQKMLCIIVPNRRAVSSEFFS